MTRTTRAAALLFVVTLAVYLFPVAYNLFYKPFFTNETAIDVVPAALLPVSILQRGDFYLDPFADFINATYRDPFFVAKTNDHLVSRYPVIAPILALPFYGIPLGLGWLTQPRSDWLAYPRSALFTARIPAAFITALAVVMLFYCLIAEKLLTQDQVVEAHVFRAQHAYPIYALDYEKHLAKSLEAISAMKNIETAGRQGRFAYINTHIAMKMGYEAADRLMAKLGHAKPA